MAYQLFQIREAHYVARKPFLVKKEDDGGNDDGWDDGASQDQGNDGEDSSLRQFKQFNRRRPVKR